MRWLALLTALCLVAFMMYACEAEKSDDDDDSRGGDDDDGDDDDDTDDDDQDDDDDTVPGAPTLDELECPEQVYIGSNFVIQAPWTDDEGDVATVFFNEHFGEDVEGDQTDADDANIKAGRTFGNMVLQREEALFPEEGPHTIEVWLEDELAHTSEHMWCDIVFESQD